MAHSNASKQEQCSSIHCLQRHTITVPREAAALRWLDMDTEADQAFFKASSTPRSKEAAAADQSDFYTLSEKRAAEVSTAAEELHEMFEAATEKVINNDALLTSFGIPAAVLSRVKDSFVSHKLGRSDHPLAGRFDLSISDEGVKAYEYNADSASCLYECGYTQGRWASAAGLRGEDAGADLREALVEAWAAAGIPDAACLHLMLDDDLEEAYHACYMRDTAAAAGVRTKLVVGTEGLHWGAERKVVDSDGEEVRFVWKTWAWETVFDHFNEQQGQAVNAQPRLADVLLHPAVRVWEPLWTAVTANKAILPVLWQMYPEHPHLLRAEFELSEALRRSPAGYVAKPIVGRCGANVTMVHGDSVVAQLGGKFDSKELVHQELCPLPRIGDKSVLVCPWVVRGKTAGLVLRVDEALITTVDSPIECLRVVPTPPAAMEAAAVASTKASTKMVADGLKRCMVRHHETTVTLVSRPTASA